MSGIRDVSKARQSEDSRFARFKAEVLSRRPLCEVGPRIKRVVPRYKGCRGRAEDLHHLRKLSALGARSLEANVLPSCRRCNEWVEDFPLLAADAGLVIRGGNPLWDLLGRRAEREARRG